jgi:hypothetical protein
MAIDVGSHAPAVPGVAVAGPHALVFYKATCSVTRMAGPPLARLGSSYLGAVVGVGQDPPADLDAFARDAAWGFPQVADLVPYEASDAYGIASAPTGVGVDANGTVADVVESWDREGMNRAAATLASLLGVEPATLSTPDDGLPDFKPG